MILNFICLAIGTVIGWLVCCIMTTSKKPDRK